MLQVRRVYVLRLLSQLSPAEEAREQPNRQRRLGSLQRESRADIVLEIHDGVRRIRRHVDRLARSLDKEREARHRKQRRQLGAEPAMRRHVGDAAVREPAERAAARRARRDQPQLGTRREVVEGAGVPMKVRPGECGARIESRATVRSLSASDPSRASDGRGRSLAKSLWRTRTCRGVCPLRTAAQLRVSPPRVASSRTACTYAAAVARPALRRGRRVRARAAAGYMLWTLRSLPFFPLLARQAVDAAGYMWIPARCRLRLAMCAWPALGSECSFSR